MLLILLSLEVKSSIRHFEKESDTLTKVEKRFEFNFLFSFASIPVGNQIENQTQFNSEITYSKKMHRKTLERLFEVNYHIGYTKQESVYWYRDDDLLKIKCKYLMKNKLLKLSVQASGETALTNSFFPTQKNTFLKEEFDGKRMMIPSRLIIGSGCQINISKSSLLNLSIASAAIKLIDRQKEIPESSRPILFWKSNLLIYEFGLLLETDFYENIGRKFVWKFQSTTIAPLIKLGYIKINSKNKFQYKLSDFSSLNLSSELEYNPFLYNKPMIRNTILMGFLYMK